MSNPEDFDSLDEWFESLPIVSEQFAMFSKWKSLCKILTPEEHKEITKVTLHECKSFNIDWTVVKRRKITKQTLHDDSLVDLENYLF